jgi:hypothetical protein
MGGETVTFTATVTPTYGGAVSGSMTFKDGTTSIGVETVNAAGVAVLKDGALAAGSHSITAVYAGSSNVAGSTSAALPYTVTADPTTTSLVSSTGTASTTQAVTFTATVTPTDGVAATGTVSFYGGTVAPYNTLLGNGTLSGGVATLTHTFSTEGSYTIYAVYDGSSYQATSTSNQVPLTVN